MAELLKIDSNITGLRLAEEASLGVLPGSPVWVPYEPNSYSDFGGNPTTTPRNPINAGRQRKKGPVTDLEATGGWENDLTQTNLQSLLQAVFFADMRRKSEFGDGSGVITAVAAADDSFAGTSINTNYAAGDLLFASGFTNAANNGLKTVASVSAGKVLVSEALTEEASPPAAAKITTVGFQGAVGDIDVAASGAYPTLTSTTLDFTTLGLIPGEWIYVGGDAAGTKFTTAANNGFARVRAVAANVLTLDKTQLTMVTEANTTATIQLFFGRVLKNEVGSLIKRRSYHAERTLGAPDDSAPTDIQAEYVKGWIPGEFTLKIPSAGKVMCDISGMGTDVEHVDAATGVKAGTRPALVEADAFNTSSDFSRIKMAIHSTTSSVPTALFAFVEELNLTINNNLSGNKAVGVLGNFEVTAGTFEISGDVTAYFANVAALAAVRANSDVTLDVHMVRDNAGISLDMPLFTLGNGRPDVVQDQAIKLPLNMDAATAALIDPNLDYTLLMMFWDYLPSAAAA